jgi:chaperonin cofactor prefoldin
MLPFLFTVAAPPPTYSGEVKAVVGGVLKRFQRGIKWAASECGYAARQHFERAIENDNLIERLARLPEDMKRAIYRDLGPLFGVSAAAAENPELEKRIADLEAERDRDAKEREALQERFNELEALVRRLAQPASPQQPHEERQIA